MESTAQAMTELWYVGDLCYVLGPTPFGEGDWDEVCNLMFPEELVTAFGPQQRVGEFRLSDGRQFFIFGTAHGDGLYQDQLGREYGVDSGTIGAIRVRDLPAESPLQFNGNFIDFADLKSEDCFYKDGVITIGHVQIDTDGYEWYEEGEENEEEF